MLTQLAEASALRRVRPGLVAEMLEPDLKDGGGGLRDIQSLAWAGDALGAPGLLGLEARGFLTEPDAPRLAAARALLLDLRVALHRVTNGRSDRLALQEQSAVAALVGCRSAPMAPTTRRRDGAPPLDARARGRLGQPGRVEPRA